MKLEVVRHDTRCAVCWGTLKKVKVVSPCLHRFCTKCIEEHLRKLCVRPPRRRPEFPIFFPARAPNAPTVRDPSAIAV